MIKVNCALILFHNFTYIIMIKVDVWSAISVQMVPPIIHSDAMLRRTARTMFCKILSAAQRFSFARLYQLVNNQRCNICQRESKGLGKHQNCFPRSVRNAPTSDEAKTGSNPLTGQVLPPGDSCNQAEVIRAFHAVLSALPEKTQKPQPENAGRPWTSADDFRLAAMYDEGKTRKEICEYFKRSSGGIASRLVHLGKISGKDGFGKKG